MEYKRIPVNDTEKNSKLFKKKTICEQISV